MVMAVQSTMPEGYRHGSKQSVPLEMTTVCNRKKLAGQCDQAALCTYLGCSKPFRCSQISLGRVPAEAAHYPPDWASQRRTGKLQCRSPGLPAAMSALGCTGITPARKAVTA